MVWSEEFPVTSLENGRTRELDNVKNCDAFDEISDLPRGRTTHDMVWVDEWRGKPSAIKTVCVRQFKTEQQRDDIFLLERLKHDSQDT